MAPELFFYDGDCGLCHRSVRFLLALDRDGEAFRFAPIGGPTFQKSIAPEVAAALPDSVVLQREDGSLLLRSEAMLHALGRIGGGWAVLARVLEVIPRGLRDAGYDAIARNRLRLFGRPEAACPVAAPQLRARFDP